MFQPLCRCHHCGLVFGSIAIQFGNFTNLTVSGNRESCPRCGQLADMLAAEYNVTRDVLEIIKSSASDKKLIEQFYNLVKSVSDGEIPEDRFIEDSAQISPALGKAAEEIVKAPTRGLATIAIVLTLLNQCNFNIDLDINELISQFHATKTELKKTPKNP